MIDAAEVDAADHLRRFIVQSAKRMRLPLCEWDDIAGDALLEIAAELGPVRFSSLLRGIAGSERILDVLRGGRDGLAARRAIKRVLKRSGFPTRTFTDIGLHDEVDDEP